MPVVKRTLGKAADFVKDARANSARKAELRKNMGLDSQLRKRLITRGKLEALNEYGKTLQAGRKAGLKIPNLGERIMKKSGILTSKKSILKSTEYLKDRVSMQEEDNRKQRAFKEATRMAVEQAKRADRIEKAKSDMMGRMSRDLDEAMKKGDKRAISSITIAINKALKTDEFTKGRKIVMMPTRDGERMVPVAVKKDARGDVLSQGVNRMLELDVAEADRGLARKEIKDLLGKNTLITRKPESRLSPQEREELYRNVDRINQLRKDGAVSNEEFLAMRQRRTERNR